MALLSGNALMAIVEIPAVSATATRIYGKSADNFYRLRFLAACADDSNLLRNLSTLSAKSNQTNFQQ